MNDEHLMTAKSLISSDDYAGALVELMRSSDLGNPEAMTEIAQLYLNNRIEPYDDRIIFYWFEKAAIIGDSFAQNNMGNAYLEGLGVEPNLDKAISWFRVSADQGFIRSYERLARIYAGTFVSIFPNIGFDIDNCLYYINRLRENNCHETAFDILYDLRVKVHAYLSDKRIEGSIYMCKSEAYAATIDYLKRKDQNSPIFINETQVDNFLMPRISSINMSDRNELGSRIEVLRFSTDKYERRINCFVAKDENEVLCRMGYIISDI